MLLGENSRKTKKRKILRESSSLAYAHSHARGYCAWRSVCRGGSVRTPTCARYKRYSISLDLSVSVCVFVATKPRLRDFSFIGDFRGISAQQSHAKQSRSSTSTQSELALFVQSLFSSPFLLSNFSFRRLYFSLFSLSKSILTKF